MFTYKIKMPNAVTKTNSSDEEESTDLNKDDDDDDLNLPVYRQALNYNPQNPPVTLIAPNGETRQAAGFPRPPQNKSPQAPLNDMDFISDALDKNNWREQLENNANFRCRANRIIDHWTTFLPQFLKKYGFTSYGANQGLKFFRPGNNDTAEPPERRDSKNTPKINSMYADSSGKRERRIYQDDEEIKRYLRHCAAALQLKFKLKEEIQCYYDDKVVYIAANVSSDENNLSEFEGMKMSVFSPVLQHSLEELRDRPDDYCSSSIWSGFDDILSDVSSSSKKAEAIRRLGHDLTCPAALGEAKIRIIKSDEIGVPIQGLHAERKILYYLRDQKNNENFYLDPLRLGGIRRPCFVCAALCSKDMSQVRPGPCWVSEAGSKPKDAKEMFLILDAIRNPNNVTYITDNNGRLTTDYDTESSEGSQCDQETDQ